MKRPQLKGTRSIASIPAENMVCLDPNTLIEGLNDLLLPSFKRDNNFDAEPV